MEGARDENGQLCIEIADISLQCIWSRRATDIQVLVLLCHWNGSIANKHNFSKVILM